MPDGMLYDAGVAAAAGAEEVPLALAEPVWKKRKKGALCQYHVTTSQREKKLGVRGRRKRTSQ